MDATVLQCTVCTTKMKLPPTHFGKKIKCPKCQAILVTGAQGELVKAISAEQVKAAQEKAAQQKQAAGGAAAAPKPAPGAAAPKPAATARQAAPKPAPSAAAQPTPAAAGGAAAASPAATKKTAAAAAKPAAAGATAATGGKRPMKPAGKLAGKGEMKRARQVKKKKATVGVKANKAKVSSIGRRAMAERVKTLDHDKDSRRIMYVIVGIAALIAIAGTAYFFTQEGPPAPKAPERWEWQPEVTLAQDGTVTGYYASPTPSGEKTVEVPIYVRNTDGMRFVRIPAGEYTFGDPDGDGGAPPVTVRVGEFYIGYREVTVAQYRQFRSKFQELKTEAKVYEDWLNRFTKLFPEDVVSRVAGELSLLQASAYNHPLMDPDGDLIVQQSLDQDAVAGVRWWGAFAYQMWANGMQPERGILPTEIEWEIASKGYPAGMTPGESRMVGTVYPWGGSVADLRAFLDANFSQDSLRAVLGSDLAEKIKSADPNTRLSSDERLRVASVYFGPLESDDVDSARNPDASARLPVFGAEMDENETVDGTNVTFRILNNALGVRLALGNAAELTYDRFAENLHEFYRRSAGADGVVDAMAFETTSASLLETYRSASPDRSYRISSIQSGTVTEASLLNRGAVDASATYLPLGFRAIYYPEGSKPPYAEEVLEALTLWYTEVRANPNKTKEEREAVAQQVRDMLQPYYDTLSDRQAAEEAEAAMPEIPADEETEAGDGGDDEAESTESAE